MAELKWNLRTVASGCYPLLPMISFYSMNLLMLGKTYIKLQDGEMAYQYLSSCRDYPMNTPDDRRANAEAKQLLAMLTSHAGRKTRS